MDDAKKIAEKHVFKNSGFGNYTETEVAETLRASGGDIGGGTENIVIFAVLQSDLTTSTSPRHSGKQ